MRIRNLIVMFFLLCFSTVVLAQKGHQGNRIRFDVSDYKLKQAAHVIKELDLTEAEAKAFIPLMNEYTEKKFEMNRTVRAESRSLRDNPNVSEAVYSKALNNYLDMRAKEVLLEKEYYEKFKVILPVSKVYRFERVERRFNEDAIARFRERALKEGGKQGGAGRK